MNLNDIGLYLPKYLSPEDQRKLFECLSDYKSKMNTGYLYSDSLLQNDLIYQGDGIKDLLVIKLPRNAVSHIPAMVISNTCDNDFSNDRLYEPLLGYCPILNLEKYKKRLNANGIQRDRISNHIKSIMEQEVTNIFFLPKNGKLDYDAFVPFDYLNCCDSDYIKKNDIRNLRLFSLSNFGIYLFIFKLSIHFTRLNEGVSRS